MAALLIDGSGTGGTLLTRAPLMSGFAEHWLRDTLFEHPALIPLNAIDPGAGAVIPICREFPLSREGGTVFLDILGMTRQGRLVLIECKLWRNPQARREVVAQILEYAALMRRLSVSDLLQTLHGRKGMTGSNPIFDLLAARHPETEEALFTDRIDDSLRRGDFDLLIVGDGIRSDIGVIAEHLRDSGARFALVEMQVWQGAQGEQLLVPHIPFRREVVKQRLVVDAEDRPVALEDSASVEDDAPLAGTSSGQRSENRAFWASFISQVRFDHPDQTVPVHGGNNWVRMTMPSPGRWITGFRDAGQVGFFLVNERTEAVEGLPNELADLRRESGLSDLIFRPFNKHGPATAFVTLPRASFADEEAQLLWLADTANRLVNAFRPRLARLGAKGSWPPP